MLVQFVLNCHTNNLFPKKFESITYKNKPPKGFMNKFFLTLLLGAVTLSGYAAPTKNSNNQSANKPEPTATNNTPAPIAKEDTYTLKGDIGVNYTFMKLSPKNIHSFTGNLGGLETSLEFLPRKFLYEGVNFLWRTGTLNSIAGKEIKIEDFDTQLRLGYVNTDYKHLRFIGFTGMGWRYLGENHQTPGVKDLYLNYNEVYIPVGAMFDYRIYDCFSFGFNATWMPEIFSTVNFVPLDNGRWVTQCKLANFQLEMPLVGYHTYKGIDLHLELKPFFQFWQDGKTLAETSTGLDLGLPQNNYYLGGAMLNFGASF